MSETLVLINGRWDGGPWTAHRPDRASRRDMLTYVKAHDLIPFDFEWGAPGSAVLADIALTVLADDEGDELEHLWALVLLGHVPTVEALETLQRWAASEHPLAGVAEMAANECGNWMRESAISVSAL